MDDLVDGLYRLAASGEHLPVNLGNPTETSLLDLAGEIIRSTGSESVIVHQALPMDDPKVRRPDIYASDGAAGLAAQHHARRRPCQRHRL